MIPESLIAARLRLVYYRPYLAAAIWALHPTPSDQVPTLAVDKYWRMYYNEKYCEALTPEQFAGALYHEISHLLRDHTHRSETLDPTISNIAGDLEINDDIQKEGTAGHFQLPEGCLLPGQFKYPDGEYMEQYYERLMNDPKVKKVQVGGVGSGNCGSIANGQDDGSAPPDAGQPGLSAAEADMVRDRVAKDVKESSQSRGDIPGYLQRWAESKLNPKIDWRAALRASVRNAVSYVSGNHDFTYAKPSRRQNGNIIQPSMHRPIPEIAIVVDTSGSIGGSELEQALAEVQGVLNTVSGGRGATVLSVDARVQTKKRVTRASQAELGGGGGTDMGVGIEAAAQLRPRPQICIVITDCYTPWPASPPMGMRVIIASSTKDKGPAWAETIHID